MATRTEQTPREARGARAAQDAAREQTIRRWERLRANGRSAFIWRNGVVGWGLPAALLTAVYKVIEQQGLVWPPALSRELQSAFVLIAVVFPVLGYVFGSWLWQQGEGQYHRLRDPGPGDREPGKPSS